MTDHRPASERASRESENETQSARGGWLFGRLAEEELGSARARGRVQEEGRRRGGEVAAVCSDVIWACSRLRRGSPARRN